MKEANCDTAELSGNGKKSIQTPILWGEKLL